VTLAIIIYKLLMSEIACWAIRIILELMMIDPKIEGKVVLITGANHGIGAVDAKSRAAD